MTIKKEKKNNVSDSKNIFTGLHINWQYKNMFVRVHMAGMNEAVCGLGVSEEAGKRVFLTRGHNIKQLNTLIATSIL